MADVSDYLRELWSGKSYLFSNNKILLICGLLVAVPNFFIPFAGLQVTETNIKANIGAVCLLLPILLVILLVILVLVNGYWIRCVRAVYRREKTLPSPFRDFGGLVNDGIAYFCIALFYVFLLVIPVMITMIAITVASNVLPAIWHMGAVQIFYDIGIWVLREAIGLLMTISVLNYIGGNRILEAAHPSNIAGFVRVDIKSVAFAIIIYVVIGLAVTAVANLVPLGIAYIPDHNSVMVITGIFNALMAFISVFIFFLNAYIFGKLLVHIKSLEKTSSRSTDQNRY
ncbi:MAG TPA: DUF4013 domain-containing protein [Methanocella sp.]|nr:DUF4013 domain-containing protein [Methanocella sp.]